MRKLVVLFVLVLSLVLSLRSICSACGDKFLIVGRGIRYDRAYTAVHRGSILIYRNASAEDPRAATGLEEALKKAGHTVRAVQNETELASALKAQKFDLVVLNLADTPLLEPEVVASPYKPAVVPVIYDRTGTEVSAAGQKYDCILKASGKKINVLSVVDEAMGEKQKGGLVKCNWSR